MGLIPLFDNTKKLVGKQIRVDRKSGVIPPLTAKTLSLLFDVIADLPEGIAVTPVFAADKAEALKAAIELFPGNRVMVVLKEGEPGT